MELSRLERLQLANQYRILEALYPDEADYYQRSRETVESGYEYHYSTLVQHINDEPLSDDQCTEIIGILGMFGDLKYSYEQLEDKTGIDENDITFPGFDGNNEYHELGYAKFLKKEPARFGNIEVKNSHAPLMGMYQRMLEIFTPYQLELPLSRARMLEVIAARVHPSNR